MTAKLSSRRLCRNDKRHASSALAADDPVADVSGAMVLINFKHARNVKKVKSMALEGPIVEKATFLRGFLEEVFGPEVWEQRKPCRLEILSKTTDGLPLLQGRASALSGVMVSMAKPDIIDRAFVIRLPQLEKHLEFQRDLRSRRRSRRADVPSGTRRNVKRGRHGNATPMNPHISLAVFKNKMCLSLLQRNLIFLALRGLAELTVDEEASHTKRKKAAKEVQMYLKKNKPTDLKTTTVFAQVRTLITQTAATDDHGQDF